MAAALLGDILAAWHLATSTEAADRGMAMRLSDVYCTPAPGEQISGTNVCVYPALLVTTSYATHYHDIYQVSDGDGGIPVESIRWWSTSQAVQVETSCAVTACRRTTA